MEVTVYTDRVQAIGAGQSITVSGLDLRKVWQEFVPNANLNGGSYIVYVQDVVGNSFPIPLDSVTNQKAWKNSFDGAAEAIRDISTITGVTPSTGVTIYSDKVQITTAAYTVVIKGEDIRRVWQEFTPNANLNGGNYIVYVTDSEGNAFPIPLDSQTNQGAWKNSFDGAAEAIKDISVIAGIAPPSGSGDVVGPASSTDNAIARFDGATGKLIQNSVVLLDDNGKLGGVDAIDFDANPATPIAERRLQWNNQQGSLQLGLRGGNVYSRVSEDLFLYAYNNSGSPMTKGQVVRVNGSSGIRPVVSLAQADGDPNSAETIGIVAETIGNNSEGLVQVCGLMVSLNTNAFNEGDVLYLSPTIAGQLTNVKPQAPDHLVRIAYCIKKAGGAGEIYISPLNGFELDELHDVRITTPATNTCGLYWNAGLSVWENLTPANARTALGLGTAALVNTGTGASDVPTTSQADSRYIQQSFVDAKGDIISASADNTPVRVPVGTNGQSLVADSGQTSGLTWRFPRGVHATYVPPAGSYVIPSIGSTALTTVTGAADRMDIFPFIPAATLSVDQLGLEVTTTVAASNFKIAIYADNNGLPGALIVGTTNLSGAVLGVVTQAIASTQLQAGIIYWLAVHSSASIGYRGVAVADSVPLSYPAAGGTAISNLRRASGQVFASGLPNPCPSGSLNGATIQAVMLRVA